MVEGIIKPLISGAVAIKILETGGNLMKKKKDLKKLKIKKVKKIKPFKKIKY